MTIIDKNLVVVSCPIVFKGRGNSRRWFIVKQGDEDSWVIPSVVMRKAESSVRAAMRMMGEKGGMDIRVLEEAGRSGGSTTVNGKMVPQRKIYYLCLFRGGNEILGFVETEWLPYAKAVRKLSKKEAEMTRNARKELSIWEKQEKEKRQALKV